MKKNILLGLLVILFSLTMISIAKSPSVSALSYQNNVDLSFTFLPFLNVTISGDLAIDSLSPGSYSDSNIVTVSTSSNNIVGYDLKATVGSSTYNYTDLRKNNSDSTNIFSSISSNISTLNSFNDDTWGYSYSADNGTTWVSGNTGNTNTGYNGLPLYTNTGILLADVSTATNSTIQFKIGAKASSTKTSGDYTNIINFLATAKVVTTSYTITYNDTSEEGTNLPVNQTGTINTATNITLSSTEPQRTGYNFLGWCTVNNTSDPTTCSGTTYQAGDTYAMDNTGGSVMMPLYAVWEVAGETWYFNENNISSLYYSRYQINFVSNTSNYTEITGLNEQGGVEVYYDRPEDAIYDTAYNDSFYTETDCPAETGWCNANYRTIFITGGEDFNNAKFRAWLSANATQL